MGTLTLFLKDDFFILQKNWALYGDIIFQVMSLEVRLKTNSRALLCQLLSRGTLSETHHCQSF